MIILLTLLGTYVVSGMPMNPSEILTTGLKEIDHHIPSLRSSDFNNYNNLEAGFLSPAVSFKPQDSTSSAVHYTSDEDLTLLEAGLLKKAKVVHKPPAQIATTHLVQDEMINNHFPSSQYKVLKYLGHGYSGKVFLVENSAGEKLALKIVSLRYSPLTDAPSLQNVKEEWKILTAVNQAFGEMTIDTVHDLKAYLPMKYIPGNTWESYLEGNSLTKEQNDKIMAAVMDKVRFIHSKGIIHGDLAARNIMLDPETLEPTLIDWGFAKESNSQNLKQNDYLGLTQELRATWNYYW